MGGNDSESWSKLELGTLCCVLLAAALLRFHDFERLGIVHYDEGGYALSAQAVVDGTWPEGGYPRQHDLAPPFLYTSAGLLARTGGIEADTALFLVCATLGTLSVGLAWLLARAFAGAAAGAAAGTLTALSDYHILYSRMALTDVPFTFFFLLALLLLLTAQRRRSTWLYVLAGVAIGLAWNTKYHGWLAGVIGALALLPDWFAADRRERRHIVLRFGLAVLVACALYLPWFLYVCGEEGGYAELMRNHRRFLKPRLYLTNIGVHASAQLYFDGWLSRLAPGTAWILAARLGPARPSLSMTLVGGLGLVGLATLASGAAVVVGLAVVGVAASLRRREREAWIPLAFLLVFLLLSPVYQAYTRLLLPFMLACYVFGGAGMRDLLVHAARHPRVLQPLGAAAGVVAAVVIATSSARDVVRTYEPSTGLERAADSLARRVASDPLPVRVAGEPGLVYYLRRGGVEATVEQGLQFLAKTPSGSRVLFVRGIYGRMVERMVYRKFFREHGESIVVLEPIPFAINEVRRLADARPWDARRDRAHVSHRHRLEIFAITAP